MKLRYLAAGGAVALAAAGCGTSVHNAMPAANVTVCHHYMAQRAWVKGLTFPTVADAFKFADYVHVDAGQAVPGTKLAHDLHTMAANVFNTKGNAYYNASVAVVRDCGGR